MLFQIKEFMRNSRGNALLNAIVIAGIVAAISGVIMTQTKTTDESSRAPRIRAAMSVMQAKVQALANQYTSYTCGVPNKTTGITTCDFKSGLLNGLQQIITGAKCAGGGQCGVIVTAIPPGGKYFDPVSVTFSAQISYQGTEVAIAPIQLQYKIPTEVLAQQQGYLCPDLNPIFQGYRPDGSMNCQPLPVNCNLPAGATLNKQGTFIVSVVDGTLVPNCNNLGALISCPANQYLSNYSWSGTAFGSACAPRTDPFAAENFTPGSPTGLPPWVTVSTTPTTLPPPTTTTTTVPPLIFSSCFVAGTPVSMADGSNKAIESVQVGEKILTYDELTDQQTISPVVQVYHHPEKVDDLYMMTLSDGTSVTSNGVHPYFLPDYHQYASAEQIYLQLNRGGELRLLTNKNKIVSITHIDKTTKSVKLYNLHVTSIYDHDGVQAKYGHNYFAGGVLVHNLKCNNGCNNEAYGDQCCTTYGGTSVLTNNTAPFFNNLTANCTISPALAAAVNACVAAGVAINPDDVCSSSPGSSGCSGGCEMGPCSGFPTHYGGGVPPTTTTTTLPLTAWNCSDGWAAAAPCNSGMNIVDDGNLSPNNPGVADLQIFTAGGNPASRCVCTSGTLTVISCSGNDRYITCAGAVSPPLACPWPVPGNVGRGCGPAYGAPAPGGWSCLGPPSTFVPCP